MSEANWSTVSATDRLMFTMLSNTDRINHDAVPRVSLNMLDEAQRSPPRIVECPDKDLADMFKHLPVIDEHREPILPEPPTFDSATPAPPPSSVPAEATSAPPPPPPPPSPPTAPLPTSVRRVDRDNYVHTVVGERQDDEHAKRAVLMDLQRLKLNSDITLTKEWSMDDSLDDMVLEMRRITLALDEQSNVSMMRDGLRMVVTGLELVNNRLGILDLEGWSNEVCRDLHKHDENLSRIYRKYWRRGVSRNPEMEIAMALFGSLGMHHMKRSMSKQILKSSTGGGQRGNEKTPFGSGGRGGGFRKASAVADDASSSDEEDLPPQVSK